ncbi:MAG: radical SAM protein, partial [Proteobacteria bacterium]|nr:radical SAM protein [Pseudomonadota bacterium]
QVGDLVINERGIAERGLLIRHLVLPNNLAGTEKVIEYVSGLSRNTYLNIMAQYRPQYEASKYPELNRRITFEEYENALLLAEKAGLTRGFSHDRR